MTRAELESLGWTDGKLVSEYRKFVPENVSLDGPDDDPALQRRRLLMFEELFAFMGAADPIPKGPPIGAFAVDNPKLHASLQSGNDKS